MSYFRKKGVGLIVTAFFSIILFALSGPAIATVFLSLLMTHQVVSKYLGKQTFDSLVFRFILSLIVYITILQFSVLAVWIISRDFPLDKIVYVNTFVVFVSYIFERFFGSESQVQRAKSITISDILAVFIAIFIIGLIALVPLKNSLAFYKKPNLAPLMSDYINTSLDDSSHLSRINDRLQLNRGVLYKSSVVNQVVHQNTIGTYPPGWHSANAVIMKAVHPEIKVGGQSLFAYVVSKFVWLFILVFCFCRVIFELARLLTKKVTDKLQTADLVWLTGSGLFFAYYLLIEQFKEGFYGFIPLLIYQLLALVFLLQLGQNQDKENSRSMPRPLFLLLLMFLGAALSWILVLPAVAIALLLIVFYPFKPVDWLNIIGNLWSQFKYQAHIITLAVMAMLVQIIVITGDSSRTFREGVNDPGAITAHSDWYFLVVLAGIILFYILVSNANKVARQITPYLVSLSGVALFIFFFQYLTINKTEYYYTKTLNTVLIVAVPIAITGWFLLVRILVDKFESITATFLSVGLVICLPLIIGLEPLNTSNLSYVQGKRAFSRYENTFMYDDMSKRAEVPVRERQADTIFYVPNEQGHNIIGTNIIRSIQKIDDCDGRIFYQLLANNETTLFDAIENCQTSPLTIVTRPESLVHISTLVNERHLDDRVTILSIE